MHYITCDQRGKHHHLNIYLHTTARGSAVLGCSTAGIRPRELMQAVVWRIGESLKHAARTRTGTEPVCTPSPAYSGKLLYHFVMCGVDMP